MNYKATRTGLSLLLILTTTIHAGTWQVGIGVENSRSPFVGEQWENSTLPMVNYIGDKFSFVDGKIQYGLSQGDGGETYILGQVRSRQFYTASLDVNDDLNIKGMEDRDPAFELGLGWENHTALGKYVLEGYVDVTDTHEGFELSVKYSYPKQSGHWMFEPAIGLQMQSSDLADYYHGVRVYEARDDRPAYRGDQAISMLTSLMVGYTINAQMLAIAGIEQIWLDSGISDSPIVSEKQVRKIFLGLMYTF